jgi:hypothetical protein
MQDEIRNAIHEIVKRLQDVEESVREAAITGLATLAGQGAYDGMTGFSCLVSHLCLQLQCKTKSRTPSQTL